MNILNELKIVESKINYIVGYLEAQSDIDNLKKNSFKIITSHASISDKGADMIKFKNKTIKKRKDGRWCTRYYDNKIQKSVYGKTQQECLNNLKEALKKMNINKNNEKSEYTFFQWLDFWNETYKIPYKKTDTTTNQIKNHIKQNFKDKNLSEINNVELQELINKITQSRTKIDIFNIIKGSLNTAFKNKIIKNNPAENLIKPIHKKLKGESLTREEEIEFFKKSINSPCYKLFLYYLFSGTRREEGLKLNKKDIYWNELKIKIHGTKTEKSERFIPLFNPIIKLLETITPDKNGYYFKFNKDFPTYEFKKYCQNHRLHDLRHTFATRALENGISMKIVQHWLGHSDYSTTANIYADVQSEYISEMTNKFNNYYKNFDTYIDTHK